MKNREKLENEIAKIIIVFLIMGVPYVLAFLASLLLRVFN